MSAQPSPSRLESFSDGVIAVIITIMVLEFKVPRADGASGILLMLPTFAVYLLSFSFTGIYWINHHHLTDRLKRVDHAILWANLAFLFTLSLLPFFTNYLVDKGIAPFPVAIYAASLLLDGVAFTVLTQALVRHFRLAGTVYDAREEEDQLAEMRKGAVSLAMYLGAIPVAYWHPWLALSMVAATTLLWIIPTFGLKPQANPPLHPTG